jgi:hypothetical protein
MSAEHPSDVPSLLGREAGVSTEELTADVLKKLTQKQLLDAARRLGLLAVSRLKKDALVDAVWDACQKLQTGTNGESVEPSAVPESAFSHKFEIGRSGPKLDEKPRVRPDLAAGQIPWGYGHDRVTAMSVDPDRLYAYWEVLETSIAAARAALGRGGAGAWLNLRVYDTTGRIFDGTNAHGTTDHRVERGDRQWFFTLGKPTSDVIVEIGMKSDEGYFVKIARSSRVEFPRREPAPWSEPEWMTVRVATGQIERGGIRLLPRAMGAPSPGGFFEGPGESDAAGTGAATATAAAQDGTTTAALAALTARQHVSWEETVRLAEGGIVERRSEWHEVHVDGTFEAYRQFNWTGPATITSWEAGPFAYPVEVPPPVRETFQGKTHVYRLGGRTHIVYGPWQVVIRGLHAQHSRAVLSRWEVYRSWSEVTGREIQVVETTSNAPVGASDRMMVGASERRWLGGSDVRLRGASEVYYLAASELRLRGASERLMAAASELRLRGASERLVAGASEVRLRGASERMLGGASESRLRGASERMLGGASELLARGASERMYLGASEGRLGVGGAVAAGAAPVSDGDVGGATAYPPPPSGTIGQQPRKSGDSDPSSRG